MNFNNHSDLVGQHAFLSASKYHWTNYDVDKLETSYSKYLAVQRGTQMHEFASICIQLNQKLPKSKKSLNNFVNDAIGYRMKSEQTLVYSENAFGTADAISFRDNLLRIHDLKTGVTATSMRQLEVYCALFCLEYSQDPTKIGMELRIYQLDDIWVHIPEPAVISDIMEKIVRFDRRIQEIKESEE